MTEKAKATKVKFLSRGLRRGTDTSQYRRMLPDSSPTWGNCSFTFDIDDHNYDWLVVYHDIPSMGKWIIEQPLYCPKERTILVTLEPSSITVFGSDYVKQFGTVITFQEPWALRHPNVRRRAPGLIWYYDYSYDHGTCSTYDQLAMEQPEKTKLVSIMCSSRTGTITLHSRRLDFSNRLQQDIPQLDVFGHGVNRIDNKAEAIRPYKYHVVIENHVAPHHLTEKLPDAFLGHTLPFYHGAPNAADYFPKESFIPIDINDYKKSVDIITSHINNNEYEDRLPYIQAARRKALEELNVFSILDEEISKAEISTEKVFSPTVIRNRSTMRLKNPIVAVRSLSEKIYIKVRHKLNSLSRN